MWGLLGIGMAWLFFGGSGGSSSGGNAPQKAPANPGQVIQPAKPPPVTAGYCSWGSARTKLFQGALNAQLAAFRGGAQHSGAVPPDLSIDGKIGKDTVAVARYVAQQAVQYGNGASSDVAEVAAGPTNGCF